MLKIIEENKNIFIFRFKNLEITTKKLSYSRISIIQMLITEFQ